MRSPSVFLKILALGLCAQPASLEATQLPRPSETLGAVTKRPRTAAGSPPIAQLIQSCLRPEAGPVREAWDVWRAKLPAEAQLMLRVEGLDGKTYLADAYDALDGATTLNERQVIWQIIGAVQDTMLTPEESPKVTGDLQEHTLAEKAMNTQNNALLLAILGHCPDLAFVWNSQEESVHWHGGIRDETPLCLEGYMKEVVADEAVRTALQATMENARAKITRFKQSCPVDLHELWREQFAEMDLRDPLPDEEQARVKRWLEAHFAQMEQDPDAWLASPYTRYYDILLLLLKSQASTDLLSRFVERCPDLVDLTLPLVMGYFKTNVCEDIPVRRYYAPLHLALEYGYEAAARLLIEKGANVSMQFEDDVQETPLFTAIKNNLSVELISFLLEKGADSNVPNRTMSDSLQHDDLFDRSWNLARGPIDTVRYPIQRLWQWMDDMWERNMPSDLCSWPLGGPRVFDEYPEYIKALTDYAIAVSQKLLAAGANINVQDEDVNYKTGGFTPLCHLVSVAPKFADKEVGEAQNRVIEFLLQNGADPNIPTARGNAPLHFAIARLGYNGERCRPPYAKGVRRAIQLLVEHGADGKAQNENGDTALHLLAPSCNEVDLAIIEKLLENADLHAKNKSGQTLLHVWSVANEIGQKVLERCIRQGVDINSLTSAGRTPLASAVIRSPFGWFKPALTGVEAEARFFLTHKADPNIPDKQGDTPLHLFVAQKLDNAPNAGSVQDARSILTLLLQHGADPALTNRENKTPGDLLSEAWRKALKDDAVLAPLLVPTRQQAQGQP